ncbi:MAG: hypothetical protein DMG89_11240 [Acidobacteria bacterium]|nr:MAG: hypothetical protein DMG89_11240 [Acidobacteriota bacterium]
MRTAQTAREIWVLTHGSAQLRFLTHTSESPKTTASTILVQQRFFNHYDDGCSINRSCLGIWYWDAVQPEGGTQTYLN